MAEGQLVSDELVEQIVRRRLDEHDWNYGFILGGLRRKELVVTADGTRKPDEIQAELRRKLELPAA